MAALLLDVGEQRVAVAPVALAAARRREGQQRAGLANVVIGLAQVIEVDRPVDTRIAGHGQDGDGEERGPFGRRGLEELGHRALSPELRWAATARRSVLPSGRSQPE